MLDLVKLHIKAGNGGDGRVSFHRAKFITKGGPDGGDGGDGGNVYLVGKKNHNTLQLYAGKTAFAAESGQPGGAQKMFGKKGEDLYLEVPLGTIVWEINPDQVSGKDDLQERDEFNQDQSVQRSEELQSLLRGDFEKKKLAEILEDGETILLCKGGKGGRGNEHFKGPSNTTPMESEDGTDGEEHDVLFELKLLADVGLVGFPNAGKSTFLSLVTKANPKIGNYPFTTLEANLGVMSSGSLGKEVVLADIPGLIEGASEGKGLGIQFLRHVERCTALMFVLYLEESLIFDEKRTDQEKAAEVWEQYQALRGELTSYNKRLRDLPFIVTVNKADLYSPELQQAITELFASHGVKELILWSGVTQHNLKDVQKKIVDMVK